MSVGLMSELMATMGAATFGRDSRIGPSLLHVCSSAPRATSSGAAAMSWLTQFGGGVRPTKTKGEADHRDPFLAIIRSELGVTAD
jgi:hypothetical protein